MRPARKAVAVTVAVVAATGLGVAPAAADGIAVLPRSPHPGQRIHISVPGCSVGPTTHIARSAAFVRDIELYGKADTGEGDSRIKKGLSPGTYAIVASCGAGRTVRGEIVVTAKAAGPEAPGTRSSAPIPPPGRSTPSPRPPASLSATPTASQSHDDSKMPFVAIAATMAALLLGGAGTLLVRRRNR